MPERWVERGVTLPEGIHLSAAQDWTFEFAAGARQLLLDHFRVATLAGLRLGGPARCHQRRRAAILQYLRTLRRRQVA